MPVVYRKNYFNNYYRISNICSFSINSPWLEGEALSNNDLHIDGSAIEKLGFQYQVPHVTEESIRGQLQHAIQEGWFPPNIIA